MRTAHCKFTAANINDLGAGSVLPLQRLHRAAFSTASTDVSPPYLSIRSLTATYPTWPHKQLNTKWFWYIHRRTIMFCSRSHSYDFSIPFLNYPSDALWGQLIPVRNAKKLSNLQLYLTLGNPPVHLKCSLGGQFGGQSFNDIPHKTFSFRDFPYVSPRWMCVLHSEKIFPLFEWLIVKDDITRWISLGVARISLNF